MNPYLPFDPRNSEQRQKQINDLNITPQLAQRHNTHAYYSEMVFQKRGASIYLSPSGNEIVATHVREGIIGPKAFDDEIYLGIVSGSPMGSRLPPSLQHLNVVYSGYETGSSVLRKGSSINALAKHAWQNPPGKFIFKITCKDGSSFLWDYNEFVRSTWVPASDIEISVLLNPNYIDPHKKMLEFQNLIEETRVRTINEIAQRQEQDYRSLNDIISSVASKINPNTVLTPSEPGMIEKIIRSPEKTSYVWDPRPSPGTRLTSWESVNFNSVEAYTSYCIRMIGSYKSSENAEVRTISYGLLNPNQQNFFSSLHGNNIPVDANFLVLLTKNDTIPLCHESWL